MVAAKVMLVDDDPAIREVVRFALRHAGFATVEAADGRAALALFAAEGADLVVLDVSMPGLDGIEVCRALRSGDAAGRAVPVLFLSSRDEEVDRVLGLEMGADDYLTKPFSPRELVARIRAVLRRARPQELEPARSLSHGRLRLNLDSLRVAWGGQAVVLTATELGLLRTLLARPGRVFSREELMDRAYATERVVSDRTVDSHVRGLRARFAAVGAAGVVETLPGFGYRLGSCR